MFLDGKATFFADGSHQGSQVISTEVFSPPACLADQQVLVPLRGGDEGMASVGLVDAQYQANFFQFFQGAIDCDQADAGIILARL